VTNFTSLNNSLLKTNVILSTTVDRFVCQFSSTTAIVYLLDLCSFIRYSNVSSSFLAKRVSATAGQVTTATKSKMATLHKKFQSCAQNTPALIALIDLNRVKSFGSS